MKQLKYFMLLGIFLVNGCATLSSAPSRVASYSNWPPRFQADYLWETTESTFSLAIQPKWVRFYVQDKKNIRCIAFNFLGATLWDVTLQQSESKAIRVDYRMGKQHPLSRWMTKMLGQVFYDQPQWRGWCWQVDAPDHESGVLEKLIFVQRRLKRILKLHQTRIDFLENAIFNQ